MAGGLALLVLVGIRGSFCAHWSVSGLRGLTDCTSPAHPPQSQRTSVASAACGFVVVAGLRSSVSQLLRSLFDGGCVSFLGVLQLCVPGLFRFFASLDLFAAGRPKRRARRSVRHCDASRLSSRRCIALCQVAAPGTSSLSLWVRMSIRCS